MYRKRSYRRNDDEKEVKEQKEIPVVTLYQKDKQCKTLRHVEA